ncbi:MAG: patatin-like phospholipase family protein [Gammaproteobacteria bacterium]
MMRRRTKVINLALQGGGAHGAFTWGVLDRLLEDERIEIEGISGSSSGAMNAVMVAYGLALDGPKGARAHLARFWEAVGSRVPFNSEPHPSGLPINGSEKAALPWLQAYIALSRALSPYLVNPWNLNPLRAIIEDLVDFDWLRAQAPIKLFVASTRVQSGKMVVFQNAQLSAEVLLASACVPSLHHAIEIEGEVYWDGGFSGNPAVFPLIFECRHADVVIVMLHPLQRPVTPSTAQAIWERMTEMAFNATFLREMRAIGELKAHASKSLIAFGAIERRFRRLRCHLIEGEELMAGLTPSSRFNPRMSFLRTLRDQGRAHAERWLDETFDNLGNCTTFDIAARFA